MEKLRIVFMGTPEFAVGILDTIIQNNYEVVGVITAADKPAGRGQKLKYSAVKEYALAHNLTLLQPLNLKDADFLSELKALNANLQIVVAFRMLPKVVWEMPSLGTFNLHASLLPNYRGAAPINWAIINGETKTGVTIMYMDKGMDTGDIISMESINIDDNDNLETLSNKLSILGAKLLEKTLPLIVKRENESIPQNDEEAKIKLKEAVEQIKSRDYGNILPVKKELIRIAAVFNADTKVRAFKEFENVM